MKNQNCFWWYKVIPDTTMLILQLKTHKTLKIRQLLYWQVIIRAGQKVRFLPNNFFEVSHNFFPLFRSKALQKTKNWKFLWIFSPGWSPSKFYYITLVCEMELGRKFKFFPIFHYKTILFSSESEFSMKNVIFWGTSCWWTSKI